MLKPTTFTVLCFFPVSRSLALERGLTHGTSSRIQSILVTCLDPYFPHLAAAATEDATGRLVLSFGVDGTPAFRDGYGWVAQLTEGATAYVVMPDSRWLRDNLNKAGRSGSVEDIEYFTEAAQAVIAHHEQSLQEEVASEKPHPFFDMGAFNAVAHTAEDFSRVDNKGAALTLSQAKNPETLG